MPSNHPETIVKSIALRQHCTADANHTIHLTLPPDLGPEVDVIVLPASQSGQTAEESLATARLIDESGFAKQVLSSTEEDCWNVL